MPLRFEGPVNTRSKVALVVVGTLATSIVVGLMRRSVSRPAILPFGWQRATVSGSTVYASSGFGLPEGLGVSVDSTDQSVRTMLHAGCSMYGDVSTRTRRGEVDLVYEARFSGPASTVTCVATFTDVCTATGYSMASVSGSRALSIERYIGTSAEAVANGTSGPTDRGD